MSNFKKHENGIPHWILEFAEKERLMHRIEGRNITPREILLKNGFHAHIDAMEDASQKEKKKNSYTRQELRLYVLPAQQVAMNILLDRIENNTLYIVSSHYLDSRDIDVVRALLNQAKIFFDNIEYDLVDRRELHEILRGQDEVPEERLQRLFDSLAKDPDDVQKIEQVFNDILSESLQQRASDIHITYQEDSTKCWIKYRIDGVLKFKHLIQEQVMAPLVTRIKTEAKMDAAERNRPQDGRIEHMWQGRPIDIRCAATPVSPNGEKLTLRLLDSANLKTFDELFAEYPAIAKRIKDKIHQPVKDGGLIILSGPTGSGKSTTLYSIVQEIDRTQKEVYTVEQPVEYEMPLVEQINIVENGPVTMAQATRSLLRHDLDMAVVGEMRDSETIEAALRLTESGHPVLTTVHAVNANHTFDRILGFLSEDYRASGIYILAQALTGIISQRLVRTLCPKCKTFHTAGKLISHERCLHFGINPDMEVCRVNLDGCDVCGNTGYLGRTVALEALFPPSDQASRRILTEKLRNEDVGSIVSMTGAVYVSRKESLLKLIERQIVDIDMAITMIADEVGELIERR